MSPPLLALANSAPNSVWFPLCLISGCLYSLGQKGKAGELNKGLVHSVQQPSTPCQLLSCLERATVMLCCSPVQVTKVLYINARHCTEGRGQGSVTLGLRLMV